MDDRLKPGLRRAMAEMIILRDKYIASLNPKPHRGNRVKKAKASAFQTAYNALNKILIE